ncbi:thiolase domain-containing protein [Candidatus Peregrinibacteria bacterium]|nr:thiolase domain-containing protein [Candidatus Peregrinibacteria bacterium]
MQREIFLIGSGQTRFGEWWDKSLRDLAEEAVGKAIADASCLPTAIDAVIVANMLAETSNNQAHLGAMVSALLPHRPPALRVEAACASGSVAVHTACALLESGRAETILVLGIEKMTDVPGEAITAALMGAADAEEDQPSGLTFPGIFGLIAQRYMHEHGLTRDELNLVSAVHHRNAVENPYAHFQNPIDPEDVGKSSPVADPLRVLDCSPISDGAAACILSVQKKSQTRLAASQLAHDTLSITERPSITSFRATQEAAKKAYAEAGVTTESISHIEHHDCFSIAAVINLEDLGFAEKGKGIEWYKNSATHYSLLTTHSLNSSGGLKACGHPVGATGVKQIIEIGKKLKDEKAQWGLAHNFGGACATCCVTILENTSMSS